MYWQGMQKVSYMEPMPTLIGIASAAGMYLLLAADLVTTPGDIINAVGGVSFGALVWYLIVRHLPAIQERHDHLMSENNKYQRERDAAVNAALAKLHDDLHDLVVEVRGIRDDCGE